MNRCTLSYTLVGVNVETRIKTRRAAIDITGTRTIACAGMPSLPSSGMVSVRSVLLRGVLLLILAAGLPSPQVAAQPAPLKGVVWTAPADLNQAETELIEMHRIGVEAVRTDVLVDERLLVLADTLGLQFFQELPLDDLSATALTDTLDFARRLIEEAVARSRNHTSARHFGLARRSDTSDLRACAFFEHLAERVHRAPQSEAYYLSAFVESDRCSGTVDFVLLDARDAPAPTALLRRWRTAHATLPAHHVGLGALGIWVRTGLDQGLNTPHTPETQARYLENYLGAILNNAAAPRVRAVFVYRWRDARATAPSPALDLDHPYQLNYGLYTSDGIQRPAYRVLHGFYSGTQTVFAFSTGQAPPQEIPWSLLFGWLVFVLIGACYALSPRFRYMVPRYFLGHSFYREAIREGREVLLGSSVALLVALGLSAGVTGSIFLETLRREAAFRHLFRALQEPVQTIGVALLAQPWMLVLLLGSVYALGVAVWTSLLAFLSRRRQPLIPGQALMLVLWAHWPFPLLMVGAILVTTLPEAQVAPAMVALAGGWLLATAWALIRTLRDYAAITHNAPYLVLATGLANPVMLVLLIILFIMLDAGPELTFFWHLITRG